MDAPVVAGLPAILPSQAIDFRNLTSETTLAILSAGREYRLSARDVIKWVAPNAPLNDALKLLVIAQNTGLNPLVQEIELIEFGGKWTVFVRKNGHMRLALENKDYDGHESGIVLQDKARSKMPFDVSGTITPQGFLLVGGWAKIYRKGVSRPVYKRVHLQDYDRNSGTWKSNPAVMIEKVAIAQALRESFPIGDTYDEAEGPETLQATATVTTDNGQAPAGMLPRIDPPAPASAPMPAASIVLEPEIVEEDEPSITSEQQANVKRLVALLKITESQYEAMLTKRGVYELHHLSAVAGRELIDKLEHLASRQNWPPTATVSSAPASQGAESITLPESTRA